MSTDLVFLPACSLHPDADDCGVVLLRTGRQVEGRSYNIDERHTYRPEHPAIDDVRLRVTAINEAADCEHGFDEDCLLCSGCGTCREDVDDEGLCPSCI